MAWKLAQIEEQPLYPLDAPGIASPGPSFIDYAVRTGELQLNEKQQKALRGAKVANAGPIEYGAMLTKLMRQCLYSRGELMMPVLVKNGRRRTLNVLSGHIWGSADGHGPERADVMLIGKMHGEESRNRATAFCETHMQLLRELCDKHGLDSDTFYVTNLVKTEHPDNGNGWSTNWVKDWLPLLHQELRLVRPKFILALGADVCQALLGKTEGQLKNVEGRVIDYSYRIDKRADLEREPRNRVAKLMGCVNPSAVMRMPETLEKLDGSIARFGQLIRGMRWDRKETDIDHRTIDTLTELKALEREIHEKCERNMISVDAEWHGEHPQNSGSYLRTIQLSWRDKTAACISLTHPGGKRRFKGSFKAVARIVSRILRGRVVVGQYLASDAEWLIPFGIDIRELYRVPETWQEFREAVYLGKACGFDTGLAEHAHDETADFGLNALTMRHTAAPRYDVALDKWKHAYCLKHKMKDKDLEGYGMCPPKILEPYGCLHKDSLVQLACGRWRKISELVREQYAGKVKALKHGKVVNAQVTGWHRNDVGQKDWFQLVTANTKYGRHGAIGPAFTPDHGIITQRGKVAVEDLQAGVDGIVTDEPAMSLDQRSVLLGSGLGDGGYVFRNNSGVGFGFSQCRARKAYVDWKAGVFSNFSPTVRVDSAQMRRYELPFHCAIADASRKFPAKDADEHSKRKLRITPQLLANLGTLGLAVWYQDDGTFVRPPAATTERGSSRIYCEINEQEELLVLEWLRKQFGKCVTYNRESGFIQFGKRSFDKFHAAIQPYMHPACAYKTPLPVARAPEVPQSSARFVDTITEVVRKEFSGERRGYGVRYCLSVFETGNFLTQAGFVSNCYDADVTRRVALAQLARLDSDRFGNCCWEAYWRNMRAYQAVMEINMTGIEVDRQRLDALSELYVNSKSELRQTMQRQSRWPDFNLESPFAVREWLYGEKYNGKKRPNPDVPVRMRPKKGKSLHLTPIMSNDKRPMLWDDVIERGLEKLKTPGTKGQILSLLQQHTSQLIRYRRDKKTGKRKAVTVDYSGQIAVLRDYRFISQVLKLTLRPPARDDAGDFVEDDNGDYTYEAGLPSLICDDNRLRTHIYPTLETCRWASSRPNLTNVSKRREKDYKRILGDKYRWPIRTIFRAPKGYVLIEADFIGAELLGAAIMSGDAAMIEHCRRNQLPETHPDYYDIHSHVAIRAFRLNCPPTKSGLDSLGKSNLRIVAKAVIFGLMYGRGAKAIAVQAQEERIPLTRDEAQKIIDTIFEMYPDLGPFFAECRARAIDPGWLCNCFGQFRRFPTVREDKQVGDFERQAMNFPMQSMVAAAMSQALDNLLELRRRHPRGDKLFRIVLQIHDAVLLLVPARHVATVVDKILPRAMCKGVPIFRTYLDGTPADDKAYHMGLDTNVYVHWGENLMPDECEKLNIDPKYAGFHPSPDGVGWVHKEMKAGSKWLAGKWVPVTEV